VETCKWKVTVNYRFDVILPMSRLPLRINKNIQHTVHFNIIESLCYEILAKGYYCKYIKTPILL